MPTSIRNPGYRQQLAGAYKGAGRDSSDCVGSVSLYTFCCLQDLLHARTVMVEPKHRQGWGRPPPSCSLHPYSTACTRRPWDARTASASWLSCGSTRCQCRPGALSSHPAGWPPAPILKSRARVVCENLSAVQAFAKDVPCRPPPTIVNIIQGNPIQTLF